jgi:CRP-like cAMP-binding protein
MLVVMEFEKDQYIYSEGEHIKYIYFINKGSCGFVLPRF